MIYHQVQSTHPVLFLLVVVLKPSLEERSSILAAYNVQQDTPELHLNSFCAIRKIDMVNFVQMNICNKYNKKTHQQELDYRIQSSQFWSTLLPDQHSFPLKK